LRGVARGGLAADRRLETGGVHRRRDRCTARLCQTDGSSAAGNDPLALESYGPLKLAHDASHRAVHEREAAPEPEERPRGPTAIRSVSPHRRLVVITIRI